jgi:hypothetical protein
MSDLSCAGVEAIAAELALGIVPGDERADALRHLATCPACRDRVDGLARVADQLLLAAPEEEPPPGFESRVLDRVAAERQPTVIQPIRRRRPWMMAAAAAAAVVVAASIGALAARGNSHSTTTASADARITSVGFGGGTWTCRIAAFPGHGNQPTEIVVRLDEPGEVTNWYTVEAVPANGGPAVPIGTVEVKSGQGTLAAAVPAGTGKVRGIRVLETGTKVRYTASFAPA